jgi:hypothetical protein
MAEEKSPGGRLARRREKRRLMRERKGDTPQKLSERKKPGDRSVKDAIARTGETGFFSGGV